MTGLFKPKTPEIKPPAPMPDTQDPAIRAETARKIAERRKSSSVAANRLTAGGKETLGA